MSIEDPEAIDAIGVEVGSGKVVLTLADELDWTRESEHEFKLQAKLNKYLAFIESGEILSSYPQASGRSCAIDLVLRFEPSARGQTFLDRVRDALSETAIELRVRGVPDP